ncbi:MAG: HAD hydrolase-like protein [Candidatus Nanohaloarchaea archaeon]|nr:HAD hydrolase-like protein [Candidatus Nanohaloarchaea archaeon]
MLRDIAADYLLPDRQYDSVTDIDLDDLEDHGYQALLVDLDQTLTGYGDDELSDDIRDWYQEAADRFQVRVLSNDSLDGRRDVFEDQLDADIVDTAYRKPLPGSFRDALQDVEAEKDETLVIGDTPLTDTVGGNLYGIDTAQVEPQDGDEPREIAFGRLIGQWLQDLVR